MRGNKLFKVFLFTIILCMLSVVYVFADEIPEGRYLFRNYNSNLYMTCDGTTSGANILQMGLRFNEIENTQIFNVTKDNNASGYYNIKLDKAALSIVVDVDGASQNNSANVQIYNNNNTDAQRWKFISNNDREGTFRAASKCSGDTKVLTVLGALKDPGTNIFQYDYTSNPDGKWYLEALVDNSPYLIRNKKTGKYLTVDGSSVKLEDYNPNNYKNQVFRLKGDNEGYYDIAPYSNLNKSISVTGWDYGYAPEGGGIGCEDGQSSEGQNWKFLLNSDGSYRIVSQISNCSKAITVLNNNVSNVYSYTYTNDKNSNWELIKQYEKESEHIICDLDTNLYLKNNISIDNFNKWIQNMDLAYEGYKKLVGGVPANENEKIHIKSVNKYQPNYYEDAVAWTYGNHDTIYINANYVSEILTQINDTGDWNFCILHEMGHAFDIKDEWVFHDELSANFKMAYLFSMYENKIKVYLGNFNGQEMYATNYEEIENFYCSVANQSYINTLGSSKPFFSNDGLTYILLNLSGSNWINMSRVYDTYYTKNSTNSQLSQQANSVKYDHFLSKMNEKIPRPNQTIKERYTQLYSSIHKCICDGLDKSKYSRERGYYEENSEENSGICDYDMSGFIRNY